MRGLGIRLTRVCALEVLGTEASHTERRRRTKPEAYAETPATATQPTTVAAVFQETKEKDARFPEAGRNAE